MTSRRITQLIERSTSCRRGGRGQEPLASHAAIVDHYIGTFRPRIALEQAHYRAMPDLRTAVSAAAKALMPNGKRSPHQCRIPRNALKKAERRLLSAPLLASRSFEDLHEQVDLAVRSVPGIGPLYVYDTALRIGAFLRLKPTMVYLHAGTRAGAAALLPSCNENPVSPSRFPTDFAPLEPHEIEDVLCIYREWLRPDRRFSRRPSAPYADNAS